MDDKDSALRERAYAIWQEEGFPEGRDADHWLQAEREHAGQGSHPATDLATPPDAEGSEGMMSEASSPSPAYPETDSAEPAPLAKAKKKVMKAIKGG